MAAVSTVLFTLDLLPVRENRRIGMKTSHNSIKSPNICLIEILIYFLNYQKTRIHNPLFGVDEYMSWGNFKNPKQCVRKPKKIHRS